MLAAGVVVVQGVQLLWLPLPGDGSVSMFTLGGSQAAFLTIVLIITTVNAVNFVDGLDGLAAGVVGIGALAFFSFSVLLVFVNGQEHRHHRRDADRGAGRRLHRLPAAQLLPGPDVHGRLRRAADRVHARLLGDQPDRPVLRHQPSTQGIAGANASLLPALLPLILPFAVLVVPFLDLVLAVVRRTREGRSPFSPDKKHLHHRLLEIGHSQRRAVLVMYLWAGLVAFGVVVVSLFSGWWSALGLTAMAVDHLAADVRRARSPRHHRSDATR